MISVSEFGSLDPDRQKCFKNANAGKNGSGLGPDPQIKKNAMRMGMDPDS
jgi:hypothetical protein